MQFIILDPILASGSLSLAGCSYWKLGRDVVARVMYRVTTIPAPQNPWHLDAHNKASDGSYPGP